MKRLTSVLAAIALLTTACGGNDMGEINTPECDYQETSIPFDQSTNGSTPEDLLATAEIEDEELTATGPDGDATISMSIQRRGTTATLMESAECDDILEIPVTVSFRTIDDDTFDEELQLMLKEDQGSLSVDQGINPEQLTGSFSPEIGDDETLIQLSFQLTIDPDGNGEALLYALKERTHTDGSLSEETEPLWTWSWQPTSD